MREAGLSFSDAAAGRPAREVVAEIMSAYEAAYDLAVARPARVDSVSRSGGFFTLETAPGSVVPRLEAPVVVSATGTWTRPRTPDLPGVDDFAGLQVDTPSYPGAARFAGLRVAVVGGGLSAIGFLDEVSTVAAGVRWYTRRPPRIFEDATSELGLNRGRAAVAAQDAAARAGEPLPSIVASTGIPSTPPVRRLRAKGLLHATPMPRRAVADGFQEQDGTMWQADAVIWALGFSPALDHLEPLGIREPGGGVKVDDSRVVKVPGLLLAGYGGQASTISAARAARRTARRVSAFLDGTEPWPV